MRSSSSVRQISITSEAQRSFFLKVEWAEDLGSGFIVLLSDGVSAWSGEVSEEDVSREARDIEMERERYVQDLHLALTGEGQTAEGVYAFHLAPVRPSSPLLQLSYEKVQSDISFRLGVVELQAVPEPSEVIRELITHSLDLSKHLEAKNQHLLEENHKLRQEQHHISTQMERYVEEKERLERELYGRFVLVLNEKKGKIRDLQAGLDELQQSVDEDEVRRKQEKSEEPEAEKSSGQEGDYDGSTEEEQEEDHTRPERSAPPKEMSENSPMDESLNDITDVAPCRKRRHRHLQQPESEAKRAALPHRSSWRVSQILIISSSSWNEAGAWRQMPRLYEQ
ncbi:DNA repair protein XRCC4 isoform X2 [Triplophysa dalaica]|uniref:DNA repair protein XRCC4 isoform X2 n=1 Tax=Triplophysa dalaica TaxID=1582913 RepID=UPI0024DFC3B9|nr:DNA repair protein XRCC4 isoform X2 [Triplophysa dalaica]